MNFRGAWNISVHYLVHDVVTYSGSSYFAESDNTGVSPDSSTTYWALVAQVGSTGPTGPTGAAGATPNFSVGTVTSLAYGATPTITNVGVSPDVKLNFGIPQGKDGTAGTGGTSSAPTVVIPGIGHTASSSTTVISLSSSAVIGASQSASNLSAETYMPKACTAVRLDVYSTQVTTATAGSITLRTGSGNTPITYTNTQMTCNIDIGTHSCSATTPVPIAAGTFVDAIMTGVLGSTSYVFTSFECDATQ